jgi:hypothetical protein
MRKSLKTKEIKSAAETAKKRGVWSGRRSTALRTYRSASRASYCGNCK